MIKLEHRASRRTDSSLCSFGFGFTLGARDREQTRVGLLAMPAADEAVKVFRSSSFCIFRELIDWPNGFFFLVVFFNLLAQGLEHKSHCVQLGFSALAAVWLRHIFQ